MTRQAALHIGGYLLWMLVLMLVALVWAWERGPLDSLPPEYVKERTMSKAKFSVGQTVVVKNPDRIGVVQHVHHTPKQEYVPNDIFQYTVEFDDGEILGGFGEQFIKEQSDGNQEKDD